ncbi:hypothetical protein GUITHDRAFT_109415 [Guillardia theta CCMP2712]|uniref:Zn(2)-C6 fungal-type domain-containing protein n=1 Tax=Guillardia theta (strain CCMP2712) TaxID=905079 RepID=L1J991_GUITC|nr:hypothetical protein GUITHDRAFT_109415 [Guillardia theta CCMP2712]EKX44640.1 hypothetical protein GUITHDRAFT_109415 [Guillardia theta CCMP2712]|eukprot:XP_005831620.1 hypothetical protein GUITHDRAFT_109415 [Guillardia theta CCMP2712]
MDNSNRVGSTQDPIAAGHGSTNNRLSGGYDEANYMQISRLEQFSTVEMGPHDSSNSWHGLAFDQLQGASSLPASARSLTEGSDAAEKVDSLTRLNKACDRCRKSKLKCDWSKPCARCVEDGVPELCQLTARKSRKVSDRLCTSTACEPCRIAKARCDANRPCSRCCKLGKQPQCVDHLVAVADRPLPFRNGKLIFGDELDNTFHVDFGRLGWAYGPIRRCWEWGHDPVAILRIFEDLPLYFQNILRVGLTAIEIVQRHMQSKRNTADRLLATNEAQARPIPSGFEGFEDYQDQMWDLNEDVGYLKLKWRKVQEERASLQINNSVSRIFGTHKEEVLARLARHELPLLTSEFEWLCRVMDLIFFSISPNSGKPMIRFERIHHVVGKEFKSALACITNTWDHDWSGNVRAAAFCLRRVSIDEFDALRSTNACMRPVTQHCLGDMSAHQMLDTYQMDVEKLKISNMKQTEQGREILWKLADLSQTQLAPVVAYAEQLKRANGSYDVF